MAFGQTAYDHLTFALFNIHSTGAIEHLAILEFDKHVFCIKSWRPNDSIPLFSSFNGVNDLYNEERSIMGPCRDVLLKGKA